MAETDAKTARTERPKPANGAEPKAHDKLLVVGGEEAGSVEAAVPAIVVRGRTVGENDPEGRKEGEHRADIVVLNSQGGAATAYTDVLVLGNDGDAKAWLDDSEPRRRDPDDVSPARRSMVAFWPSR
jgi:hypothetical protein